MLRFLSVAGLSVASGAYCEAGPSYAVDTNLGGVTLTGEGNSIHDTTNCPGVVGRRDLTSESATLRAGGTYTLTFMSTTCGGAYSRYGYAYIDFNQDEKFEESELLGTQLTPATYDPVPVSFQFTVPQNVVAGTTRLRVFIVEAGSSPDPCLYFSYGGVKDFSIVLLPLPEATCCVPTTYSSVSTVLTGNQMETVYAYQDNAQQAYLERSEIKGQDFSAILCLASAQFCYAYNSNGCQRYSFIFPTQDCPGTNSSKFKFQGVSVFSQGGPQLTIFSQPAAGITITTTPLGEWCVYNTWLPDSFYNSWDLNTPPASVFAIPAVCSKVKATSPPAKLFRR